MANNNHFELTLDTIAPVGTISGLGQYEKENKTLTFTNEGADFKKVWFDTFDADTVSKVTPEDLAEWEPDPSAGYRAATWESATDPVESAFSETENLGIYYYHVVFMDSVNNESEIYTLGPVYYDPKAPVITVVPENSVYLEDSRGNRNTTNSLELKYGFSFEDVGSGVVRAQISGTDFDTFEEVITTEHGQSFSGTITLPSTAADGDKQISVVVYDRAGNASAPVQSNKIILDRELDKPTLLIQDALGNNLPDYINYNTITVNLTSNETNIAEFQVWEGSESDGDSIEWKTQETVGTLSYTDNQFKLSAGDGEKFIYARIKDTAGNITSSNVCSVIVDTIKPTASIEVDKTLISKIETFNKAIISLTYADERSGIASSVLVRENATGESFEITEDKFSSTEAGTTYEVTVGALADGAYTYYLKVKDNAGNEFESNRVTVIFDTTAPDISITTLNTWYTEIFDINVEYNDANGYSAMSAWVSTIPDDTTVPEKTPSFVATPTISKSNINFGGADQQTPTETANNYMHVQLVDAVGNVNYAHAKFGFDSVPPVIDSVKFTKTAYPTTAASINLTYSDVTSGVVQMRVSGDITDGTSGDWEEISSTYAVTLSGDDGIKTVVVTIRDEAGLTATQEITCELDRTTPVPALELYDAENVNVKPAHSPLATFSARISITGDDNLGGCEYQLYGDFAETAEQEQGVVFNNETGWKAFKTDEGQTYMTISGLYCTKLDGVKEVYIKVRDNAGNIYSDTDGNEIIVKKSFVYDTTVPSVTVSDIDHNRISKVHALRIRNSACTFENCYADECRFTFTPDSTIQAYKVCAYMDANMAAAVTDVEAEVAIGNAHGSVNMSATGLESNAPVNAKITGADYEATLGGSDESKVDGAHYVVVYVQDLAGQWSVAASFEN